MGERAPAPKAGDKLTFLLALVPYLIDQVRVSVDEAAAHFGVTPQRVRDAVSLITTSGLPGDDGAYSHADLFDIDWTAYEERDVITIIRAPVDEIPRLSSREAAALLAGLQVLAASPSFASRTDAVELMELLGRGASESVAPVAVAPSAPDELRALLTRALEERRRVRLDYVSTRGERHWREVDPIRLDGLDDVWYLRAWCLLRDSERTFRLDRVAGAELLGPAVEHEAVSVDPAQLFRPAADDQRVTVRLPATSLTLVADYRGPDDELEVDSETGMATLTLTVGHDGVLGRLVSCAPGAIEVVAPREARAVIAAWARTALTEESV
jgi:proteasome accessory factor C